MLLNNELLKKYSLCDDIKLLHDVQTDMFSVKHIQTFELPIRLCGGIVCADNIGAFTTIGDNAIINRVKKIGRFCSIADHVVIGQTEHPTNLLSTSLVFSQNTFNWHEKHHSLYDANNFLEIKKNIEEHNKTLNDFNVEINDDVWIGYGVIIKNGVKIGSGAIVGAGSVVTKDVPPYSIVAGCPAKLIRKRFEDNIIKELLKLQWWKYGADILKGIDLINIETAINIIKQRINNGFNEYCPQKVVIKEEKLTIIEFD